MHSTRNTRQTELDSREGSNVSMTITPAQRFGSGVESEQRHVAVREHVIFSLETVFADFARCRGAAEPRQIRVADHFRLDEALFEIRMDDTGRLGCFPALLDRPRTHFLFASREIRLQSEQGVRAANQG